MNEEQLKNYGSDNVNALEIYKKAYLTKMPEKLEEPKDIPIGLILREYWCDSCSYYQVIKTTDKSVVLIEIPSIQVSFDHEGGGTGYSYIMPDFVRAHKLVNDYEEFVKEYGDVKNNAKLAKEFFSGKNKSHDAVMKYLRFDYCGKKITKRVKPTKDGFYIPGNRSGNMRVWDGTIDSEYYI